MIENNDEKANRNTSGNTQAFLSINFFFLPGNLKLRQEKNHMKNMLGMRCHDLHETLQCEYTATVFTYRNQ